MTDLATLEKRIAALEDIEAIKRLKYRYFRACDSKDPEAFRNCFAEGEIVIEYGRIGSYQNRDDLAKVFAELACQEHIVEMHHAQNPDIEIMDKKRARGTWSLYYYMINTRDQNAVQLGGIYRDEYVHTKEGWRMSGSVFEVTSTQMLDFNEGLRLVFAGRTAPVEIDDPSSQA